MYSSSYFTNIKMELDKSLAEVPESGQAFVEVREKKL